MRKQSLVFLLALGIVVLSVAGCGYDPTGTVSQIRLAIYTPDCVDVLDASMAAGAHLQIYAYGTGKLSQEWAVQPVNNGQNFMFVNANSKMCMSVASTPDTAPGQFVIQAACDDSAPDEIWSLQQAPGSERGDRIVSLASGQCLDLPYGAVASIFTVQQYTCDTNDRAQGWNIQPVSKGNTP